MNFIERLKLAWRVMTYRPGNLMAHARRELGEGLDVELKELLLVFSSQGHSGGSAAITTDLIERLMRYEPLGPLLGTDDEWVDVAEQSGYPLYQNKRCGRVFKDNRGAYDIEGIIWEDPDGTRCTNVKSHVAVVFPYFPLTNIVKRYPEAA